MPREDDILNLERKFIYLLLHNRDCVSDWMDSVLRGEHFHKEHRFILDLIIQHYDKDVLLTRNSFNNALNKMLIPQDRVKEELTFNKCLMAQTQKDDFPLLINQILDSFLLRASTKSIEQFGKNIKQKDCFSSLGILIDGLQDVAGNNIGSSEIFYDDMRTYSKQFIKLIEDYKSGKIKEEEKILCGIKEIDDTMMTGFAKGTLTLICGDVGSYKSTSMLNIGLNIWKKGYNVLFVPIEMAYEQMFQRAIARESKVPFSKLMNKSTLSDEDEMKVKNALGEWDNYEKGKFYILQMPRETTVSSIRRQIEKHINIFKPDLIVVDYIAILKPDKMRTDRNDLEIGEMLKDLRQMGKTMQFAIVSGAQLGREALKKIRKFGANNDKATINSEDLQGSHQYSADADYILAQVINVAQPNDLLDIYVVKSRNGKKIFSGDKVKGTLEITPEIGLIKSMEAYEMMGDDEIDEMFEQTEEVGGKIDSVDTKDEFLSDFDDSNKGDEFNID